jgi:hypothetical protein
MKFSNPIPGSKVKTSTFSKTVELSSFQNDLVVSPYDGTIVDNNPNTCGGNMVIKHVVDNETYFSEFCNLISPSTLFSGVKIRQGQTIGQSGSNNVEYTIKNSRGKKEDVEEFFSGSDKTKKEKEKSPSTLKVKDDNTQLDSLSNALLKGMLFPFGMVSSTMEKNKEKKKNDQLSEEIQRIKTLLK